MVDQAKVTDGKIAEVEPSEPEFPSNWEPALAFVKKVQQELPLCTNTGALATDNDALVRLLMHLIR